MTTRSILYLLAIATLVSCQTIIRYYLGIKQPDIEKKKTIANLIEKNKIINSHFLKKEKIHDAYIGSFPKVFVYDRNGYQVILPSCYEMIEENLKGLVDTIPEELSTQPTRDKFVQENIDLEGIGLHQAGSYDYEVYFYWSAWLGKFNIKKILTAQKTIDTLNQGSNHKKIILIPVNFDFIEESGWTEQSVEVEMTRIMESQKNLKNSTAPIHSANVSKTQ